MSDRRPAISQAMRSEVAERYGCIDGMVVTIECHYCDAVIVIDRRTPKRTRFLDSDGRSFPELDHVEPLALDGPHDVANLAPACLRCNRSKGARRLAASGDTGKAARV